ncbi:K_tetra-domain-containing protein [Chaetoceros tenuissimus]|uniref:K_tetra-domain-containing protein n=1 Tax=Chaetoceros tenuissimus TaxID=426638 RepID=A0AAD3D242_9STRA|nr:K_tetra-domain-containing protein [Chaetoceros tenuissimus]
MTQTIKFNVGGTRYEVSRSLIEAFPQTLLERSASKVWNEGGDDEIFIEGNGHRFQYVLDFMRYGKITLPSSESNDVFFTEMEYYGLTSYLVEKAPSLYETIMFNVSGTTYEVPISFLDVYRCRGTTLKKRAEEALKAGRNVVFIEGNGNRFQYVLDYLRRGKVDLPLHESREELLRDLHQYSIYHNDLLHNVRDISKNGIRDF